MKKLLPAAAAVLFAFAATAQEPAATLKIWDNDREEIYRTSARYYQCTGDNERAAAYVDSVLTYYAQTGKKADLGSIYMAQSHMYEAAGNACSSPAASSCCFWPVGASIWASWSGG